MQPAFSALKSHYAIQTTFCNLGSGNEKGLVENLVGYIRRNVLVPVPRVNNMEELQHQLDIRCRQYQKKQLQYQAHSVEEALTVEKTHFTPLPAKGFDYALTRIAEVNRLSLVKFDRNRYSVPVNLAGKSVTVKGYPFQIKIYYRSQEVAVHPRSYQQGETKLELAHYLPLLIKKPRSLQNAAPLRRASLPPGFSRLKEHLLARGEDQELAQVLGLIMTHGMEDVEKAIELAIGSGQLSVQAIRYYMTTKESQSGQTILSGHNYPRVESVNLQAYDRLIGGGERR